MVAITPKQAKTIKLIAELMEEVREYEAEEGTVSANLKEVEDLLGELPKILRIKAPMYRSSWEAMTWILRQNIVDERLLEKILEVEEKAELVYEMSVKSRMKEIAAMARVNKLDDFFEFLERIREVERTGGPEFVFYEGVSKVLEEMYEVALQIKLDLFVQDNKSFEAPF